MSDARRGRDEGETGSRIGLHWGGAGRMRAVPGRRYLEGFCWFREGVAMAAAVAPVGVALREATQRKLRRFSELRGSKEGTPALRYPRQWTGRGALVPGNLLDYHLLSASHLRA